jgi:RHS repeat-associated protein
MNAIIAGLTGRVMGARGSRARVVGKAVTNASVVLLFLSVGAVRAGAQEVIEYYGTDALGSVRIVFAPDGTVKSRGDYLPFGEEWGTSTPGGPLPTQRFTGQERDAEENLDYFKARSYQTRTGRFTTVDPIYAGLFEPQRWNRYSYALANPLKYTDPSGMHMICETTECVTVTAPDPGPRGPGGPGPSPFPGSNGGGGGFTIGGGGNNNRGGGGNGGAGGGTGTGGGDTGGDGGGDNNNGGQTPGGNNPPPGAKPLPPKVQAAIDKAYEKLKKYQPSGSCQANVLDKFGPDFSPGFQSYLNQGASFYDGTRSSVPMSTGILGGQAGISYSRSNAPQTVSGVFRANAGTNAMTSVTTPNLTVYVRPSTIDQSNSGANMRNHSLLFHEALHGYTRQIDTNLQSTLGLSVGAPSGNITAHIAQNCQ